MKSQAKFHNFDLEKNSKDHSQAAPEIKLAIEEWVAAIGKDAVKFDATTISRYARSTSNAERAPLAVLHPRTTEQVQSIVTIANHRKVPLHPISRGKNWGYGDACAPSEGQVIVDFSEMNRILEVNEELGYIRIEPGVSQGQLHRYLVEHNLPLWMDSTAAGPDASIVGNTLDRGFGHTRYGDRSQNCCGMTVVLPDGRILKTGFGHYPNSKVHQVYRNGVGPWLDGLFFQSNFGIVTEMGIWLMPKPEAYSAFFINAKSETDLDEIIDRLAPLKRQGLLTSAIHIANDLRILSNRTRYPWARANGQTPLPNNLREELRREFQVGAWIACGAIYGTKEVVLAIQKTLTKELRNFKPIFLDDRKMARAEKIQKILNWFGAGQALRQKIESARPILELLKGVPTKETVHGGEWRLKNIAPGDEAAVAGRDPLESNAGLMWVSPILPMTSVAARDVLRILDEVYGKYGFDTLVTFTMLTERALCCVSNIAYDRRDELEVTRAKICCDEVYGALINAGYIPYRSGGPGFAKLTQNPSVFWDFAGELKDAIDPNQILSPGRYIPKKQNPPKARM